MRDIKFTAESFHDQREGCNEERVSVLDSLACDSAVKDDGTLLATPICFMFGQGHQHFLERLHRVPAGVLPTHRKKRKCPSDLNSSHYIFTALFNDWTREDPTDIFRWDPAEDRRYSLRASSPSSDPGTTQHGANRLAAVALPLLPVVTIRRRGFARVLTPMTRYGEDGGIEITWPIWTRPAALTGITALLSHPAMAGHDPNPLNMPSTAAIFRASRIVVGKYFCVTQAIRVA